MSIRSTKASPAHRWISGVACYFFSLFCGRDLVNESEYIIEWCERIILRAIGTRTPLAPASNAYLICQLTPVVNPVAAILTMALGGLPLSFSVPWIAATSSATPGFKLTSPCSQSMTMNAKSGLDWAIDRAWKNPPEPLVSQAPNADVLFLKCNNRAWGCMDNGA